MENTSNPINLPLVNINRKRKFFIIFIPFFILFLIVVAYFVFRPIRDEKRPSFSKNTDSHYIDDSAPLPNKPTKPGKNGTTTSSTSNGGGDCEHGNNDDYLHEERFVNSDGSMKCADGIVIFDHQITPKFKRTIIPFVKEQSGETIDLNQVDFYITLPATGEEVVYYDIFNWYDEEGNRAVFNTNKLLWEKWRSYIEGHTTYDFGVKMIHRPTGADISIIFKEHTTMTLFFDGLE